MNRPVIPIALATLLAAALRVVPAAACPYNVRDVGFVDLGDEPYRVRIYVNADTEESQLEQLRLAAAAALADGHAAATVIRVSPEVTAAQQTLKQLAVTELPAVVLQAPHGQLLHVTASHQADGNPLAAVAAALDTYATSPARQQLVGQLVDAYAVVLLIEGADATANRAAEDAARAAIDAMTARLPDLPKRVKDPPVLLRLARAKHAEERLLLWCLGRHTDDEPAAAVLYGRGRQMGPLLVGPALTAESLTARLELLGQSCECDLDRGFADAPPLPLPWTEATRGRAVQHLGFDPESDAVKGEIRRILARGPGGRGNDLPPESLPLDPLLGYSEFDVEPDVALPETTNATSPAPEPSAPPMRTANTPSKAEPRSPAEPGRTSPLRGTGWSVLGVLAAVIVIGGGLLMLKR